LGFGKQDTIKYYFIGTKEKIMIKDDALYKISDSNYTLSLMCKRDYITSDVASSINKADILLIPNENYINYPVFPEGTRSFFDYLKEHSVQNHYVADICICDDKYKELEMHDATIILSSILVQEAFYSVIIDLISNYIYDLLKRRGEKSANLKTDIIIEKDGESRKIHYDGPTEEFDKIIKSIKKNILW